MKRMMTGALVTLGLVGSMMVSAPMASAAAPADKNDNLYISAIRGDVPEFKAVPKKMLIRMAKTTCSALKSGASAYDVIDVFMSNDFTEDQTAALVAGAVVFYCPNQSYKFD